MAPQMERFVDEDRRCCFGKALSTARQARNISQAQLGKMLGGITQSAVSAWESGEAEPSPETVFHLERRLDVRPGQLSKHLGYVPAGTKRSQSVRTPEAIQDDPDLDDFAKRVLIAAYRELLKGPSRSG